MARSIRTRRRAREWSQQQLATAAGVGRNTVVNVERGTQVSPTSIRKIVAALDGHDPHGAVAAPAYRPAADPVPAAEPEAELDPDLRAWPVDVTDREIFEEFAARLSALAETLPAQTGDRRRQTWGIRQMTFSDRNGNGSPSDVPREG